MKYVTWVLCEFYLVVLYEVVFSLQLWRFTPECSTGSVKNIPWLYQLMSNGVQQSEKCMQELFFEIGPLWLNLTLSDLTALTDPLESRILLVSASPAVRFQAYAQQNVRCGTRIHVLTLTCVASVLSTEPFPFYCFQFQVFIFIFFEISFILFFVYVCLSTCRSVPCTCLVPMEAGRRHWIFLSWSYIWL